MKRTHILFLSLLIMAGLTAAAVFAGGLGPQQRKTFNSTYEWTNRSPSQVTIGSILVKMLVAPTGNTCEVSAVIGGVTNLLVSRTNVINTLFYGPEAPIALRQSDRLRVTCSVTNSARATFQPMED